MTTSGVMKTSPQGEAYRPVPTHGFLDLKSEVLSSAIEAFHLWGNQRQLQ